MRFHHAVLFCRDTEVSRGWYERAGFAWLRGHEGMHWFRLGGGELMLHPSEAGPTGPVPELYVAVDDIDARFAQLRAAGITPVHHQAGGPIDAPHTTPWGSRELEAYDPDGHRWGFVHEP